MYQYMYTCLCVKLCGRYTQHVVSLMFPHLVQDNTIMVQLFSLEHGNCIALEHLVVAVT